MTGDGVTTVTATRLSLADALRLTGHDGDTFALADALMAHLTEVTPTVYWAVKIDGTDQRPGMTFDYDDRHAAEQSLGLFPPSGYLAHRTALWGPWERAEADGHQCSHKTPLGAAGRPEPCACGAKYPGPGSAPPDPEAVAVATAALMSGEWAPGPYEGTEGPT